MKFTEKQSIVKIALAALFAAIVISGEIGLIRSLNVVNLPAIIIHWICIIAFCFAEYFLVFGKRAASIGKKKSIVYALSFSIVFLLQVLLLVGFRKNSAAILLSSIFLVAGPIVSYLLGKKKRMLILCVATLVAVSITVGTLYCVPIYRLNQRIKNAPITAVGGDEDFFGHGLQADKIYYVPINNNDTEEVMLANSLQGILSTQSTEQLLYKSIGDIRDIAAADERVRVIEKYYPSVQFVNCENFDEALTVLGGKIDKYILYDATKPQSVVTAANLCRTFDAVMLTPSQLGIATGFGWEQAFDATDKDEKWLIQSEYFKNVSKTFLFLMKPVPHITLMYDYAIAQGAWMVINDMTEKELENNLKHMNRNCVVLGGLGNLSENGMVNTVAAYSGTFVFASSTNNLSTLSGFRIENAQKTDSVTENGIKKKTVTTDLDANPVKDKHTVCIMLSDGDNLRFSSEQCLVDDRFYASDSRSEDLPMSIGISGSMVDIAPIILLSYYDKMFPNEDFVIQISSLGYTYPSKWKDEEAWQLVINRLAKIMDVADIGVVEIMDDISFMGVSDFPSMFDSMGKYFDTYTAKDEIDGCLFINFMDLYAGFKGEMYWSNGKPVVSARYSIWNDESVFHTEMNEIENIAEAINGASIDVASEDAYSFVIVHSWSGVDENGKLIADGDAIAAMAKLKSLLDEDVDVVTADEFIARIKQNVTDEK